MNLADNHFLDNLGSPQIPRHSATVGSYKGGVSLERGTPVTWPRLAGVREPPSRMRVNTVDYAPIIKGQIINF